MACSRDPSDDSLKPPDSSPGGKRPRPSTSGGTAPGKAGAPRSEESEADFDFETELLRSFDRLDSRGGQQQRGGPSGLRARGGARDRGRDSAARRGAAEQGRDGINRPFERLSELVHCEGGRARGPSAGTAIESGTPRIDNQAEPSSHRAKSPGQDEDAIFLEAMAGVEPLSDLNELEARRRPAVLRGVSEEAEALARLSDLVTGSVAFDVSDTVEYVEGIAKGLDRRLLSKLRRGHYSVQAHLDLHGMTRQEAKAAVFDFFLDARRRSLRCLLVITGRGRHSQGKEPVLKAALTEWLTGKRLGRHVLAFCSARPHDGGAGAFYVLLRR